jgi:hypothetical protein
MTVPSTPNLVLRTRRETHGMTGAVLAFGSARRCPSFQGPSPILEELAARLREASR